MRILVVDDNGLVRKSAAQFLEDEGHQVFEARDGHEAIDQVERHHPHLVLMDVQMPNMDGAQATRVLRARGVTVPIFAWTEAPDALAESRHLFTSVFMKPISMQTIYQGILLRPEQERTATAEQP